MCSLFPRFITWLIIVLLRQTTHEVVSEDQPIADVSYTKDPEDDSDWYYCNPT